MTGRLGINATIVRAQQKDLEELKVFFKQHSAYPSPSESADAAFKKAHRAIYGLCLWSNEFASSPIYQRVFLDELRSDVLQSIHMAIIGFKKPVALLLRSAIEDVLRHVFYYDHLVEFEKLELSPSSYEKMNDLWQYAKTHPRLEETFDKSKSIALLENEYANFSRIVHSGNTSHMSLTKSLSEIGFDASFFNDYSSKILVLAGNLHFVLCAFYQRSLGRFNPAWKNYVINMIPSSRRSFL